ncbi:MAG TPA: hybrid sensor histidine kinase/response regulator [Kofleriaceae bacterium]
MGRVLVVDDNVENRMLAQATLDDADIPCSIAADGNEGIAAFEREQPDCVLLDIRMPQPDGVTVCKRIRALPGGARVAIVFLTAERTVETFDRALAAGGDDFITKPFDTAELVARIRTAVRLRRITVEHDELAVQLKHQRDELQRLQLRKEQLAQFLVHDFKNPVSSIGLQVQRILRDRDASERSRDAARRIASEADHLLRLITNLLDLSKADEGRLEPMRGPLDLAPQVDEIIARLAPLAAEAQVTLVADVMPTDVLLDGDLVLRTIANLVENAIRHAPANTQIGLRFRTDNEGLNAQVSDAGAGISPAARDLIFERFVSGGATRSNRGLGLSFCRAAVEAHGGRIWVEDNAPGARFCFTIPRP